MKHAQFCRFHVPRNFSINCKVIIKADQFSFLSSSVRASCVRLLLKDIFTKNLRMFCFVLQCLIKISIICNLLCACRSVLKDVFTENLHMSCFVLECPIKISIICNLLCACRSALQKIPTTHSMKPWKTQKDSDWDVRSWMDQARGIHTAADGAQGGKPRVEWGRYSDRLRGHLHEYGSPLARKRGKALPRMVSRRNGFRDWSTFSFKETKNCRILYGRHTDCPVTKDQWGCDFTVEKTKNCRISYGRHTDCPVTKDQWGCDFTVKKTKKLQNLVW